MNADMELITLERLKMGVSAAVSDRVARSLEVDRFRDPLLRSTIYSIQGYFASNKVFEEERVIERALTWRERFRALIGKPLPVSVRVEMRRNCPHIDAEPMRDHVNFLTSPSVR